MLYVALSWHEDCISNALTNMLLQAVEALTARLHVLISVSLRVNLHVSLQALLGDKASCRAMRQAIHRFVSLRRYEQMSVHQAMQGIKLATIAAIQPPIPHGVYPFASSFGGQLFCTQLPIQSIDLPLMRCKTCQIATCSFLYVAIAFASTLCLQHPGDLSTSSTHNISATLV